MTNANEYRIDHYYAIEGDGEIEEGHIFCTPAEGQFLRTFLMNRAPTDVAVTVEAGGEYDYTTEETDVSAIAQDIWRDSGFNTDDSRETG